MAEKGQKYAAQNRKARHDYFIEDTYEAGIVLSGTEVKSIRAGTVNMKDSYCYIEEGELFATGIHISPYEKGNIFNVDPLRDRKLLMHKKEILKLFMKIGKEGYTLVPLSMYFSGKNVKVEVGVCKGKKLWDKRETEALKAEKRDIERYERDKQR
ncbi:MAG: SsrA-binding protein SmpB [Clostridia bacterium]|nr:SsrA-binding protein SmpB [Clostridia bacterium]